MDFQNIFSIIFLNDKAIRPININASPFMTTWLSNTYNKLNLYLFQLPTIHVPRESRTTGGYINEILWMKWHALIHWLIAISNHHKHAACLHTVQHVGCEISWWKVHDLLLILLAWVTTHSWSYNNSFLMISPWLVKKPNFMFWHHRPLLN